MLLASLRLVFAACAAPTESSPAGTAPRGALTYDARLRQQGWGMDFEPSGRAREYLDRVTAFIDREVLPIEQAVLAEYAALDHHDWKRWHESAHIARLRDAAKSRGLWNLFLPDAEHGAGFTTLDYAPLAEAMGRVPFAAELFNCNAPDTGNMEVLHHFGSPEQKARWLAPLLDASIRSSFCMTEPGVASSDATNIEADIAFEGDDVVVNGRKWWIKSAIRVAR